MKTQPLPRILDARKFARSGVQLNAVEPVTSFPRFAELLSDEEGSVDIDLDFHRDEARAYRIAVKLSAKVNLVCQRCLQAMPSTVQTDSLLGLVWSDDTAKALPKDVEPLILGEEALDVLGMLEDELIVGTPFVAYHEAEDCKAEVNPVFADDVIDQVAEPADTANDSTTAVKENPFAVLASLKKD